MNIKQIVNIIGAAMCLLLASCGTQIQMSYKKPAQVFLGSGASVWVNSAYQSYATANEREASRHIVNYLRSEIAKDGYYRQPGYDNYNGRFMHEATINVRNVDVSVEGDRNYSYYKVYAEIQIVRGYQILFDQRLSYSGSDIASAARDMAYDVSCAIVPTTSRYYVRVKGNDENPAIEQGAKACQANNWAQGRAYAEQAIATNSNDAEAHYLMGLIERYYGNYAASTACFQRACAIDPQSGKYAEAINDNAAIQSSNISASQQKRM